MSTFILIHGAWHGGWCWERIVPMLRKQGHNVFAPDLPGMGLDQTPLKEITLEHWVNFICEIIRNQNEKVILVGHSRGGILISQVAERMAKHIQGLIYLTAFLIPNGSTLFDALQSHPRPKEESDIVISPNKTTSTIKSFAVRKTFYNTTSNEWIIRAESKLGPEPMNSFITPLSSTQEHFGQVPRTYIECLQDQAIPITMQRSMRHILPCKYVATLDTDHSPFYSAPEELVEVLINIVSVLSTT